MEWVDGVGLDTLRTRGPQEVTRQLRACKAGDVCVVNAVEARDLEVFVVGCMRAESKGPPLLFRTALVRRSRTFTETSDTDVITEVLAAEGVSVEIDSGEAQPQIVQHQATDWDFALQRAGALGLVCDCDGGTARFFTPDPTQAAARTFEFGRDLHRMCSQSGAPRVAT